MQERHVHAAEETVGLSVRGFVEVVVVPEAGRGVLASIKWMYGEQRERESRGGGRERESRGGGRGRAYRPKTRVQR